MQEMNNYKYSCKYYDHYSDNDYNYIIMEKYDGDLQTLLIQNENGI